MKLNDLLAILCGDMVIVDIGERDEKRRGVNYQTMQTYGNYHVIKIETELDSRKAQFDNSMRINPVSIIYVKKEI